MDLSKKKMEADERKMGTATRENRPFHQPPCNTPADKIARKKERRIIDQGQKRKKLEGGEGVLRSWKEKGG